MTSYKGLQVSFCDLLAYMYAFLVLSERCNIFISDSAYHSRQCSLCTQSGANLDTAPCTSLACRPGNFREAPGATAGQAAAAATVGVMGRRMGRLNRRGPS